MFSDPLDVVPLAPDSMEICLLTLLPMPFFNLELKVTKGQGVGP
jgi:hypothetical protein